MIRVGVFGAGGRMGATVCDAVADASDLELVAAVDPFHAGAPVQQLTIAPSAEAFLDAAVDVAVDFTVVDASRENIVWCAEHDVHAVVGTTGFGESDLGDFAARFDRARAN